MMACGVEVVVPMGFRRCSEFRKCSDASTRVHARRGYDSKGVANQVFLSSIHAIVGPRSVSMQVATEKSKGLIGGYSVVIVGQIG
jgi:hypothetical protein